MRLEEKAYPVRLVLKVAGLSSAAWYTGSRTKTERQRPGLKSLIPDEELLAAIRRDLATTCFSRRGTQEGSCPA